MGLSWHADTKSALVGFPPASRLPQIATDRIIVIRVLSRTSCRSNCPRWYLVSTSTCELITAETNRNLHQLSGEADERTNIERENEFEIAAAKGLRPCMSSACLSYLALVAH